MSQHKKPCSTCPFTSNCPPDALGGSPPETYVVQCFLPFRVPCHDCMTFGPNWKTDNDEVPQCAGMAQTRHAMGASEYMPDALFTTPRNPEDATFRDVWDFYAHHCEISREQALEELDPWTIHAFARRELFKPGFRVMTEGVSEDEVRKAYLNAVVVQAASAYVEAVRQPIKEPTHGQESSQENPSVES